MVPGAGSSNHPAVVASLGPIDDHLVNPICGALVGWTTTARSIEADGDFISACRMVCAVVVAEAKKITSAADAVVYIRLQNRLRLPGAPTTVLSQIIQRIPCARQRIR